MGEVGEKMNRQQRRQLARQLGWRGSKAKRRNVPMPTGLVGASPSGVPAPSAPPEAPEVREHRVRQEARTRGLLVPPTAAERSGLRDAGHAVPETGRTASGLYLP